MCVVVEMMRDYISLFKFFKLSNYSYIMFNRNSCAVLYP